MRWDALFEDMEAQLASERLLDLESEISERARVEMAGIEVSARLRGAVGQKIDVQLRSGTRVSGTLSHVGSESLVLDVGPHQWLVPVSAALTYQGLGRQARAGHGKGSERLGLASALRMLARDRAELAVYLLEPAREEPMMRGVIDRVGKDHFDLAVMVPGEFRRSGNVAAVETVPFHSLAALRSFRGQDL
ncbi:hypothetical protein [Arthrobacter bambusae]|uniref:hypothetical protein n=1 Tax=Arthrobacter bambusae TaxID=1338426 RepID=UPI002786226A|nr:hypothetical protein [Arthrobacter bambusae]MDQ0030210.1 molybdopterin-binding protein [Arthrobacter bambusae]MDQ0097892.1 molybdopterin-binding protein [Arthrobacter bambusae]